MGMLEEVGNFLQGQGIGTQGTDIFLGDVPQDAPEAAVAIFETSGLASQYVHGINGPAWNMPSFQVFTRAATYSAARSKAETIFKALSKITNQALDGILYMSIRPVQSPFSLGRDENHRPQIVCNYQVTKVPS